MNSNAFCCFALSMLIAVCPDSLGCNHQSHPKGFLANCCGEVVYNFGCAGPSGSCDPFKTTFCQQCNPAIEAGTCTGTIANNMVLMKERPNFSAATSSKCISVSTDALDKWLGSHRSIRPGHWMAGL